MGMQGIKVGMRGIMVGMRGMRGMWGMGWECVVNNKIEIEKNEIIQFQFFFEIEKTKKKENEIRIVIKR